MSRIYCIPYLLLYVWNINSFNDVTCPPITTSYCLTGRQGFNQLINGKYAYGGCHHNFPYYKYTDVNSVYIAANGSFQSHGPLYIVFNVTYNVIEIKRSYSSGGHYALCYSESLIDCNKQWLVWNGSSYHKDQSIHFGTHCLPISSNLSDCNANPNEILSVSVAFDSMNMSGDYSIAGCYGSDPYFMNDDSDFYLYGKGNSQWVYPWYIGTILGDYDNFTSMCRSDNLSYCVSNDITFYDLGIDDKYLTQQENKRSILMRKLIQYVGIPIMSIYVLLVMYFAISSTHNGDEPEDDKKKSLSMMDVQHLEMGVSQRLQSNTDDIESWLETEVGLNQYVDNFISNGYERFDIIMDISDAAELFDIGITSQLHQEQILEQISRLKNKKRLQSILATNDIKLWLETIVGLEQYADNFISNGYERFDIIMDISDATELSDIDITSVQHQTQLIQQISILKNAFSDKNISENQRKPETVTASEKIHNQRAGNIDDNEKKGKTDWKKKAKFIAKCVFALLIKPCLEIYDYYTDIVLSSEWINDYDYGFGHGTKCKVDLTAIALIMLICSSLGFMFGAVGQIKMVKQTYFANKRLSYQSLSDLQRSKINFLSLLKLCIENMVTVILCLTVAWDKIGSITTTSWFLAYYSSVASLAVSVTMFIRKESKAGCKYLQQRHCCFQMLMMHFYVIFLAAPAVLSFLPLASLSDMHAYKMGFAVNANGDDVICGMHNSQYDHGYDWWIKNTQTNIGFDLDEDDVYRIECILHEDDSSYEYVNGMRCNILNKNSEQVLCRFAMIANECAVNEECAPYSHNVTVCFGYPGHILQK